MHAERKLHIKHLVWKKSNNEAPERDGQADDPCPTRTIALLNNHQHIRICYKKKQQRAASSEWDKSMYISLNSFFFSLVLFSLCVKVPNRALLSSFPRQIENKLAATCHDLAGLILTVSKWMRTVRNGEQFMPRSLMVCEVYSQPGPARLQLR